MHWMYLTVNLKEVVALSRIHHIRTIIEVVTEVNSHSGVSLQLIDCHFLGGPDCGTASMSNVISTSYSYNEADLGPAYTARQCAE